MRIGIDAGGTFTDFVLLHDDGRVETFKLMSSRTAPHEVILRGIAQATGGKRAEVVHGSTVATNALLDVPRNAKSWSRVTGMMPIERWIDSA